MEERCETFTLLIAKISRSIRRIKTEQMAEFHLKGPHVSCLYYLSAAPLTAAELCERCDEDKAAISRSLDYLEKTGHVCREGGADKRYRSMVYLTEKGAQVARGISDRINSVVAQASAGLGDEDRRSMYRALSSVCGNLARLAAKDEINRDVCAAAAAAAPRNGASI